MISSFKLDFIKRPKAQQPKTASIFFPLKRSKSISTFFLFTIKCKEIAKRIEWKYFICRLRAGFFSRFPPSFWFLKHEKFRLGESCCCYSNQNLDENWTEASCGEERWNVKNPRDWKMCGGRNLEISTHSSPDLPILQFILQLAEWGNLRTMKNEIEWDGILI